MKLSFRHLAATTTAMAFGLILLGVYTGAIGAGLACGAAWPFCDGWLGLFPANWPSFVEWFHRLVAMITGFFIIGTAALAWRRDKSRLIRYTSTLAVLALPVQVLLGANTIFNYGVTAQLLHHTAAQIIFGSLAIATTAAFLGADNTTTATADADSPNAARADD
jgi:cytochrome c oxidase assembly protein subunit 15